MTFYKSRYCDNNNLAIVAMDNSEGYEEYYGNLTVNIDTLDENLAALDTNNFPNAENIAKELGAEPTDKILYSGFCEYPVYDFSKVVGNLEEY